MNSLKTAQSTIYPNNRSKTPLFYANQYDREKIYIFRAGGIIIKNMEDMVTTMMVKITAVVMEEIIAVAMVAIIVVAKEKIIVVAMEEIIAVMMVEIIVVAK